MRKTIAISLSATALLIAALLPGAAGAHVGSLHDVRIAPVHGAGYHGLGRLIAPPSACPSSDLAGAPDGVQRRAMLCLTNYARHRADLGPLNDARKLDHSARSKSRDIIRCDSFSHEACGRSFTYWMQRVGYIPTQCWRVGENIAWGTGSYGTVRAIFTAWIHSPGHRENILGSYGQVGIALRVGDLDGYPGAHVWTQQFGLRC